MLRMTAGTAQERKPQSSGALAGAMKSPVQGTISFQDRLLAEGIARLEQADSHRAGDRRADERGRRDGGTIEQRIVTRAAAHRETESTREAVNVVNRSLGWLTLLLTVLGCALGFATVRTTLAADHDGRVNIFLALGGMLGIQTLLLLIWLVAIIVVLRPGRRSAFVPQFSLGSFVLAGAMWLVRKIHSDIHTTAAVQAIGRVYASSSLGRWGLSSITHGFWAAFNVGCLISLVVLLSARHYVFVWETTILNEQQYVQLTQAIGKLPEAAGFVVPTEEQIIASRWTGEPLRADGKAGREAWSSFLVGSIVLYGFGPRLLLLGYSLSMYRRGRRRYRLDLSRPEFARLQPILMTEQVKKERGSTETDLPPAQSSSIASPPPRSAGPPVIVGIEMDRTAAQRWQSALEQPTLPDNRKPTDLGIIETGEQQRMLIEQLRNDETEPTPLVIVCSLASTPDRGIEHVIRDITASVHHPPKIILAGGHALRERVSQPAAVDQRIADWHAMLQRVGVPSDLVFELDLDLLTDENVNRLTDIVIHDVTRLDESRAHGERRSHLAAACASIVDHAEKWLHQSPPRPTTEQQAELHRAISSHYAARSDQWKQLFGASIEQLRDHPEQALRDAAGRMRMVLPERLRSGAQWAAAGAAAGALGCIAASLALTPLAITALPAWSMLGGAVAGLWRAAANEAQPEAQLSEQPDEQFALAMRAAALFAVVLELQGNDESTITRILDRTFEPDEPSTLRSLDEVRAWFEIIRHRVESAQQAEGLQ